MLATVGETLCMAAQCEMSSRQGSPYGTIPVVVADIFCDAPYQGK